MQTEAYLSLFYPFEKLDVVKKGIKSSWNINQDRAMQALTMTFAEQPMATNMQFQHQYAEPYEWIVQQFKDWAFTLTSSFLFYHDYDQLDEASRNTYRMGIAAFWGITPTYHIALFDKPTMYFAALSVRTSIMCIKTELRTVIRTIKNKKRTL